MSCYCKGNQLIHICICCHTAPCRCNHSHQNKPPSPSSSSSSSSQHLPQSQPQNSQQNLSSIIAQIQKNYANLLEQQLRKLSDRKEKQIDELMQQLNKYRSDFVRLENRNKLDRENQNRLKQELSSKNAKIRQLQQSLSKQQSTYRTLYQKFQNSKNPQPPHPPQPAPFSRTPSNQLDLLKQQIIKLKSSIYELQQTNKNLKEKLQRDGTQFRSIEGELRERIGFLEQQLANRNKQLNNTKNQITYLNQKVQILTRPVQHNEPIFLHKVTTQPAEIRTIYVDRPVQKTKIVELQRVINRFIQPERPIVNRIVECSNTKLCKCDSDRRLPRYQQDNYQRGNYPARQRQRQKSRQQQHRSPCSPCSCPQYEQLIDNYKNQRQRLVKVIEDRSSDYRLLEKKIQLCQKINGRSVPNNYGNNNKCQSIVQVTVYKDGRIHENQRYSSSSNSNPNNNNNNNNNKNTRNNRNQKPPIRTPTSPPNKKTQSKYKR